MKFAAAWESPIEFAVEVVVLPSLQCQFPQHRSLPIQQFGSHDGVTRLKRSARLLVDSLPVAALLAILCGGDRLPLVAAVVLPSQREGDRLLLVELLLGAALLLFLCEGDRFLLAPAAALLLLLCEGDRLPVAAAVPDALPLASLRSAVRSRQRLHRSAQSVAEKTLRQSELMPRSGRRRIRWLDKIPADTAAAFLLAPAALMLTAGRLVALAMLQRLSKSVEKFLQFHYL